MKTAVYALLLWVALCCGCGSGHTPFPPLLRQAERWAEVCPDSALACLDSLDVYFHKLPEEVRMYSRLLRVKAEDKLYILHTSDSLINRIVGFYERRGDRRRLAEALYYQGGVYRDSKDAPRAIRSYRRAAEVGFDHDTLNGRIYGELAALYAYQKAYDESMEALRQALDYHMRCNDYLGVAYCWRDMARIFDYRDHRPDSAEVYYRKAYTLMREKGFVRPAYGVLSEWASFSYGQGQYDRAKAFASEVLAHRFSSVAALTLAKYYKEAGCLDSARYYGHKALEGDDIYHHRTAYGILKEIALSQGRAEDARRYSEHYQTASDSISRMTRTEAVVRIAYEAEKQDLLSRLKWQHYVLASALLLLVAGAVYTFRHIRAARKEHQLDEERVQQADAALSQLKEQMANEHKEAVAVSVEQDCFAPFLAVTHSSQLTREYWSQLTDAINETYPNFISSLYQSCSKLSSHELHVCYLTKIGMPRKQMAELLNHSASSISNTLSRLYAKMTGEKGSVYKMVDLVDKLV